MHEGAPKARQHVMHPLERVHSLPDRTAVALAERLFDRWALDEATRRRLRSGGDAAEGNSGMGPRLSGDRARRLLEIHAGLTFLFPVQTALRWSWVGRPNRALEGRSPLQVMLDGDSGLERVAQLVRRDVAS